MPLESLTTDQQPTNKPKQQNKNNKTMAAFVPDGGVTLEFCSKQRAAFRANPQPVMIFADHD